MGYITYKQADSRWGSKNYNGSSTMAQAGCGAASVAMLAYAVDGKTNPWDVAKYMKAHGYAIRNNGTAWAGIPAAMKAFGLKDVKEINVNTSMENVWKYLAKGYCAVFLFRSGKRGGITWTTSGHYVAVTGYKVKDGKHYLYTRDSGGRNHTGWYCYETQMRGLIPKVWVGLVEKKEEKPVSKPTGKYSGTIAKPTLKRGSTGVQVEYLQRFLNWYLGIKLKIDRDFGAATEEALEKFQVAEGLVKDGIYGTKSYANAKAYKKASESTTPTNTTYKVIDISYWQQSVDWGKVAKDGVKGAVLRASYTAQSSFSLSKDSTFVSKLNGAYANDIAIGAYHYSQAISVAEAKKEAEYICSILLPYKNKITMPVVCDWEFGGRLSSSKAKSLGKTKCTEIISAFCDVVKQHGYTPMVYANYSTFSTYLDRATLQKKYLIWLAQYASKASMDYDMWQYSSSGSVSGISGKIDVNKAKSNVFNHPNTKATSTVPSQIVKKIDEYAHPYGTAEKKWAYDTGAPLPAYKTALKKEMGKTAKVSQSDCGYLVDTIVIEVCHVDDFLILPSSPSKDFPKLTAGRIVHNGGKIVDGELQAGDAVAYKKKKETSQHAMFYYGNGKIAEAGRKTRFPVIRDDTKKYNASNVDIDTIRIIRFDNV